MLRQQQTAGNRTFGRFIQAKLQVSQPGDAFEQEADRVADHVMRMPVPGVSAEAGVAEKTEAPLVQRVCAECEGEMKTGENEDEKRIQPKQAPGGGADTSPGIETQIDNLSGRGEPLPQSSRAFFEPRFGHDFSQVRIHTDERAAHSARSVNALAFTLGSDVVFGAHQYAPETEAGNRLLAHELTHVVQQRSGAKRIQRYEESTEPNTALGEAAADVGSAMFPVLGIARWIKAAICLSGLERPMIDITFNRWIADACRRIPSGIMHSREWDAFGHCWIGCEGSRKCGVTPTAVSGTVREFYREAQRILKIRPHDSLAQDLANQALGRALSFAAGTCYSLCDNAHRTGRLNLSAPVAECLDCSKTPVPCPP